MHSGYFIDDKAIYRLEYFSYPDGITRHNLVEFDSEDKEKQFENFAQEVLYEGQKMRGRQILELLGGR